MAEGRRGGLVVRIGERLAFLPATVAVRVVAAPKVARIPGAPGDLLGVALYEGSVLPVVSLVPHAPPPTPGEGALVVCAYGGELVGLLGAEIVEVGVFSVDKEIPDGVIAKAKRVAPLDLAAIVARVQSARPLLSRGSGAPGTG